MRKLRHMKVAIRRSFLRNFPIFPVKNEVVGNNDRCSLRKTRDAVKQDARPTRC